MEIARGVSQGVGSEEVLTFSFAVSSSAQKAIRPMIGLFRLGFTFSGASSQVAVRPSSVDPVGTVSVPSDFTIVAGGDHCSGVTIGPKKSCFVMVEFSPSAQGPCSQTLSIPYNGAGASPVSVALSGTATAVSLKAPASVTFAPTAAGTSSNPKSVTITNSSVSASVVMGSAALTEPLFTIASDTCSGATLGPRKHCVVSIDFASPQAGVSKTTESGNLSFSFTYGVNGGSVATALSGAVK
jgi:hypothetical protein